ncbi:MULTISPECIES: Fe-S cluster assembly protein SufD [unclassified Brevundimonas]|uniref:Fe-S cluster assembly protein SufD n=1 Tax=unclassified Brevundimonas TaxID=2622653 RepID=UPI0025C3B3B3|nr:MULTISPECIES: Fe-S cluster assembly protein SufD [unclassified Brevundimonas]
MSASAKLNLFDAATYPSRRVEAWKYSDLARILRDAPEVSPAVSITSAGFFDDLADKVVVIANGRCDDTAFVAAGSQMLALRMVSDATATAHMGSFAVTVPSGAALTVVETYEGAGAAYASQIRLTYKIESGASLTRIVIADDVADAVSIIDAEIDLAPEAKLAQTVIATGAKLQRIETRLAHHAAGADARLDGVYVLDGSRHTDLTSVVDHLAANGTTSQLTKGVARETSRGVFQGKIIVERGADGTDARMAHNALIAGERAEIDAKPELIIYADDVQCAHGNTVGTLDEAALFYMQARGITVEEARALLTQAFLIEVIDRIEREDIRERVGQWLTERL